MPWSCFPDTEIGDSELTAYPSELVADLLSGADGEKRRLEKALYPLAALTVAGNGIACQLVETLLAPR